LVGDFEMLRNLKMIFKNLPLRFYVKYSNIDEAVRNMNDHKYLMGKYCKIMYQFTKLLARQGEMSDTFPTP
jgi:hypothetical protein